MIDFSEKTFSNILRNQLARVPNTIDKRETSLINTALSPESWYIEGLYLELAKLQANGAALTAVGQALDYKVAERGIVRRQATCAIREGVFNMQVPIGARFSTVNGTESLIYAVTKQNGAQEDGYYHCELTCETAGVIGNGYTGQLLAISFISDLSYAQLTSIIINGSDVEEDDSLRQRYVNSLKPESFAGNIAYYKETLLQDDRVGAVQVYPVWQGGGTVKCSVLDSSYNVATEELITQLQEYICPMNPDDNQPTENGVGKAPIGAKVNIATATNLPIRVNITLKLAAGVTSTSVKPKIEQTIEEYFCTIRKAWDNITISNGNISYIVNIYLSRILTAVMEIAEVINVTDITLTDVNSDMEYTTDINLIETGEIQQIPIFAGVVINGS